MWEPVASRALNRPREFQGATWLLKIQHIFDLLVIIEGQGRQVRYLNSENATRVSIDTYSIERSGVVSFQEL
jgi:hypothetical protein